MKDLDGIILFVVGSVLAVTLFWGVVTGLKKTFSMPKEPKRIDTTELMREQKRRSQEIKEKQREFMRDQQQKMRDYRKF